MKRRALFKCESGRETGTEISQGKDEAFDSNHSLTRDAFSCFLIPNPIGTLVRRDL